MPIDDHAAGAQPAGQPDKGQHWQGGGVLDLEKDGLRKLAMAARFECERFQVCGEEGGGG